MKKAGNGRTDGNERFGGTYRGRFRCTRANTGNPLPSSVPQPRRRKPREILIRIPCHRTLISQVPPNIKFCWFGSITLCYSDKKTTKRLQIQSFGKTHLYYKTNFGVCQAKKRPCCPPPGQASPEAREKVPQKSHPLLYPLPPAPHSRCRREGDPGKFSPSKIIKIPPIIQKQHLHT